MLLILSSRNVKYDTLKYNKTNSESETVWQ